MEKKKKVTTRDIASVSGVSQSTVSMILSGKTDVHFSDKTITKVTKTAEMLGYQYVPKTQKKKARPQSSILIMCPSLSTEYYTTLIQAISEFASRQGLFTLTAYTMRTAKGEEYYLNMAMETGLYGIVYTYPPKAISMLNKMAGQYPVVLINDYNPQLKLGLLELDSAKSGRLIARHLLDLGHRNIGYLSTPLSETELPRLRRLQGMKEEFLASGEDPSQIQVISLTEEAWNSYPVGNRHYDAGYRLATDYFKNPSGLTAFVGTNDFVALGIMDAVIKLGYSVPKDFSICGFDNTLVSSFSGTSLTTIDHCIEEKGKDAVDMLLSQRSWITQAQKEKKPPIMRLEYEPQLVVRGSTGNIR